MKKMDLCVCVLGGCVYQRPTLRPPDSSIPPPGVYSLPYHTNQSWLPDRGSSPPSAQTPRLSIKLARSLMGLELSGVEASKVMSSLVFVCQRLLPALLILAPHFSFEEPSPPTLSTWLGEAVPHPP